MDFGWALKKTKKQKTQTAADSNGVRYMTS